MSDLGFFAKINLPYETAIEKVTEALKAEGFGVLTSIDVKDTLKKKINADFRKYTILGACNPHLANRAFNTNLEVGLFLPCNVAVYEEGDQTVVNIIDPASMMDFLKDPSLEPVAEEARAKLKRVHQAIQN